MSFTIAARGALGAGVLLSSSAFAAGGHFVVDDTGVTETGRLALESWYSRASAGNDERAAVLAYGIAPGGELALEGGRERVDGTKADRIGATGKWNLADAALEGLGVAVVGGVFFDADRDRFQEAEVFFPVDVPLGDGRAMFRYNLGWSHQRDADDRNVAAWGFGGEVALLSRLDLLAEIYGDQRDSTEVQTGLRLHLAENVTLDAGYGRERRDRDKDWWTVGLAATF